MTESSLNTVVILEVVEPSLEFSNKIRSVLYAISFTEYAMVRHGFDFDFPQVSSSFPCCDDTYMSSALETER